MAVQQQSRFIFVPWNTTILSLCGTSLLYVTACHRELIPYGSLSVVGTFLHWLAYDHHYLMAFIWWGLAVIHILEGLYAWYLTSKAGMNVSDQLKWVIQTTVLGLPSTLRLTNMLKKRKCT